MNDPETVEGSHRRLPHVPALDGLRGIAVLLVVGDHVQNFLIPGTVVFDAPGPLVGGFLGVDLFFVLSGFLITSLLLDVQARTDSIRLRGFYRRRAVRLLPALYALLAAHWLYALSTGLALRPEWLTTRAALVYVSNWTWKWDGLTSAPGLGHLWSLAVEEQFYLLWPAVIALILGIRRHLATVVAVLTVAIACVAIHRAMLLGEGQNWFFLYIRTDTRIDSLLVGALGAHLWVRGVTPRRGLAAAGWAATVVMTVSVTRIAVSNQLLYRGWFTVVAVASATLVIAAVDGRWSGTRLLELRALRGVGRVSYGLYLWHLAVFDVTVRYGVAWPTWLRVSTGLVASAVLTATTWRFVEQPVSRALRSPRPRQDPVPVAATG